MTQAEKRPDDLLAKTFETFVQRELGGSSILNQATVDRLRLAYFAGAATVNALYIDATKKDAKTFIRTNRNSAPPVMHELRDCGMRIHRELDAYVRTKHGVKGA